MARLCMPLYLPTTHNAHVPLTTTTTCCLLLYSICRSGTKWHRCNGTPRHCKQCGAEQGNCMRQCSAACVCCSSSQHRSKKTNAIHHTGSVHSTARFNNWRPQLAHDCCMYAPGTGVQSRCRCTTCVTQRLRIAASSSLAVTYLQLELLSPEMLQAVGERADCSAEDMCLCMCCKCTFKCGN